MNRPYASVTIVVILTAAIWRDKLTDLFYLFHLTMSSIAAGETRQICRFSQEI